MNCFSCNISTNREGSAAEHSPCLCYTGQSTKRGKSQGKKVTEGQVHRRSTNKGDSVNPVRNNDSTGTGAVRCTTRDARIENRMI